MDREMYLYECTDCVLVFGVETAYEDHSQIVCPGCKSDESLEDAGCAMAILTREPEVDSDGERKETVTGSISATQGHSG